MPSSSRLRLSAGLLALTLALGACGGGDQPEAPAAAPAATSGTPEQSSSPSSSDSASASSTATTAAPSGSAGRPATSAVPGTATSSRPASASGSAAGTTGSSSSTSSSSSSSASGTSASNSSASKAAGSSSARADKPAPVRVKDTAVPAAQDLGGPKPGVAASDTPVTVETPKPVIPVEKIAPEHVRPSTAPTSSAPTSSAAPSASSARPTASANPTVKPTAPSSSAAPSRSSAPSAAPSTTPAAPAPSRPVTDAGVNCAVTRCIALTFDDGPGRHTGRLLDILHAKGVPATFYVVGQSAKLNPAVIARMGAEGHQVGNHSFAHPNLTQLSPAQVRQEITATDAAIRAAGVTPSTVRAPYGALNESVLATLGGLPHAGSVTWSVDTRDWEHRTPSRTLAEVKRSARAGGIVLMHDIHATTVDAVPAVIDWLRAQGYTFVTVDRITGGVPSGTTRGSGLHP